MVPCLAVSLCGVLVFELMLILMFAHGRRCFHRYYCPTRSTDPDTYPCTDRAYFCPAGAASASEQLCDKGAQEHLGH